MARRLGEAGYDPEVVNYGQLGWVASQELVALVLELRAGHVPDAVVFWDGLNEVNAMLDRGVPGVTFREEQRKEGFEEVVRRARRHGAVDLGLAVRSLFQYSHLYDSLVEAASRPPPPVEPPDPRSVCRAVVDHWLGVADVVRHLGAGYGFETLMIWQPTWGTSARPRSPYERAIASSGATILPRFRGLDGHQLACAEYLDASLAAHPRPEVRNWSAMHSADTATVFVDEYSHTAERATAIEADSVTAELLELLRARPGRDRSPRAGG